MDTDRSRELAQMDAAVAEAVGLVYREIHAPELGFNVPTPCWIVKDTTKPFGWGCVRVENWHPSTSIADAFAALDAVMAKRIGWAFALECLDGHAWWAEFFPPIGTQCYSACRSNYAEAICRAILELPEATDGH